MPTALGRLNVPSGHLANGLGFTALQDQCLVGAPVRKLGRITVSPRGAEILLQTKLPSCDWRVAGSKDVSNYIDAVAAILRAAICAALAHCKRNGGAVWSAPSCNSARAGTRITRVVLPASPRCRY